MGKVSIWFLGAVLTFLFLGVAAFWALRWNINKKTADVDEMCRLPVNTPVEQVIPKARSLGFTVESDFSLPSGIEVFSVPQGKRLPWTDDSLPGLQNGRIVLGKVLLPPFMRGLCEVHFENRVVVKTRRIDLD